LKWFIHLRRKGIAMVYYNIVEHESFFVGVVMWSIPLYGSLAIQGYGVALCCGVVVALWCATRHIWCHEILGVAPFLDVISYATLVGIIGARLLHVATEWHVYDSWLDMFKIWEGGLSILGTVLALLAFIPWYTHQKNMPLVLMLDLCGLYAPLIHAIARIGCWTAGCCGGIASKLPWAIQDDYGHLVHPTQWYSSFIFLLGFFVIRWIVLPHYYRAGLIITSYILLISGERWIVDWWRCDRIFIKALPWLSLHQYVAMGMFVGGMIAWHYLFSKRQERYEHLSSS
jgi:phosphatidylglycerol:prolipoprotein diacylglycerol transferase